MKYQQLLATLVLALGACEQNSPSSDNEEPKKPANSSAKGTAPKPPPPWSTRRSRQSGFPCDVEAVLSESCRRCHWDPQENDAPFALKSWKDTQELRSDKPIHVLMKQMVEADLMPPLDALVTPDVEPLTPTQKSTLMKWLRDGAQRSDEVCKL